MMRMSTQPTGVAADGNAFTISFWINLAGGDTTLQTIFSIGDGTVQRLGILRTTGGKFQARGFSFGASERLTVVSSVNLLAADTGFDGSDGWTHVYLSVNLGSGSNGKLYFNGVEDTSATWSNYSGASSIDLLPATPRWTIGADQSTAATNRLNGALSELVFFNTYSDNPTGYYSGTAPISPPAGMDLYFSTTGSGDNWATDNSGNGNNFTVTASPLGSPSGP